jgi:hypothetical protein
MCSFDGYFFALLVVGASLRWKFLLWFVIEAFGERLIFARLGAGVGLERLGSSWSAVGVYLPCGMARVVPVFGVVSLRWEQVGSLCCVALVAGA